MGREERGEGRGRKQMGQSFEVAALSSIHSLQ